jgi:hypothetical protein
MRWALIGKHGAAFIGRAHAVYQHSHSVGQAVNLIGLFGDYIG